MVQKGCSVRGASVMTVIRPDASEMQSAAIIKIFIVDAFREENISTGDPPYLSLTSVETAISKAKKTPKIFVRQPGFKVY